MSAAQLEALNRIIRNGWKSVAKEDQSDGEAMTTVAVQILEALEKLESTN